MKENMFYAVSAFAFLWLGIMAYYYYTNISGKFIYKLSLFMIALGFQFVAGAVVLKLLKNINMYIFVAANLVFFGLYCVFYFSYMSKKISNAGQAREVTMELNETEKNWDKLAQNDPLYGVASDPGKLGNKWDEKEFFLTGVQLIESMLDYGTGRSIKIPGGKALDFGCGVGRLSQALSHRFDSVTGVDISPTMIKLAREYDKSGGICGFVLNEKNDLSIFAGESFDFIFTDMVLQHMATRYAVDYIKEFARVLKKGGLLVFQLPDKPQYSQARIFLKKFVPRAVLLFYRRLKYGHAHTADVEVEMNGIDKKEVIKLLTGLGLKVLDSGARYYWAGKPL